MTQRVLFYVQHLLGIGHLKRAAAIVAAMTKSGLDVTVAHGGTMVAEVDYPGATVHRLPSAGISGSDFSTLIDADGRPVDEAWRTRRRDELLALARSARPHVALFELFPFGRRQFRFELLPLIEELRAASPRPRILSSVRDILVRSPKPEREVETAALVRASFDEVLVHGDPAFVPFGESFGQAEAIADLLRYTGYVSPDIPADDGSGDPVGRKEVVVSAGGGAAGAPLLLAALGARSSSAAASLDWRLITGPRLPDMDFDRIAAVAEGAARAGGGRIAVERFRSDFPAVLGRAALSISQGGYNTTIDILRSRVPAIVVPFSEGDETEQEDRARRLAERGYLHVLTTEEMAVAPFSAVIDAALADAPRRRAMPPVAFALEGAATTAAIVAEHARAAEPSSS